MSRGSARLGRPRRYGVYAVTALLWLSGAAWVVAHYWLVRPGAFGPQKSPLEGWSLVVHGGFAMAALWVFGLLWDVHVLPAWRQHRGRWTGGLLFAAAVALMATGYGLYYLGDEDWRARTSVLHWGLGLLALPAFLWHRFAKKARPPPPVVAKKAAFLRPAKECAKKSATP